MNMPFPNEDKGANKKNKQKRHRESSCIYNKRSSSIASACQSVCFMRGYHIYHRRSTMFQNVEAYE